MSRESFYTGRVAIVTGAFFGKNFFKNIQVAHRVLGERVLFVLARMAQKLSSSACLSERFATFWKCDRFFENLFFDMSSSPLGVQRLMKHDRKACGAPRVLQSVPSDSADITIAELAKVGVPKEHILSVKSLQ